MKLASFTLAVPVAVAFISLLGLVATIGIGCLSIRDYVRWLRNRRISTCSWCGCRYVQGVNRRLWTRFGMSTGSHGICRACCRRQIREFRAQP